MAMETAGEASGNHCTSMALRWGPLFVFVSSIVLVLALLPALGAVSEPKPALHQETPYGYTWSLLLFVLPVIALATCSSMGPSGSRHRVAMWTTICIFAPIGFLLDISLGLLFFEFPNASAVMGWYLPGYDWDTGAWVLGIPVEEFAFYGFGVGFVIFFYVWLNENFLSLYRRQPQPSGRPVRISWGAFGIGGLLIIGAVLIRNLGPAAGQPGFPGWATFLIVIGFLPAGLFFNAVRNRVNWQAFAFVLVTMVLISVIWEVTMALPYRWWGFREEQMLGLYINAWNAIPVEEPVLWVMVSFTTIISYEAVKAGYERRLIPGADTVGLLRTRPGTANT